MNQSNHYFGKVQPLRILLADGVSIGELSHALRGSLLCHSPHPGGGIVVHRLPSIIKSAGFHIACDVPPGPEVA